MKYFDSSVKTESDNLRINGYELIRADHPSNAKKGGVCIYYKESLAVKMINISYLQEFLLREVIIDNIKGYIALVY